MSARVYFDGSSLDEAAKGYFTAIKEALKPQKFHVQPPTPELLRKAQKAAVELKRPIPCDAQKRILPHPSSGTKSEIFKKEDFKQVDSHALNAPGHLVTANIEELVSYLVDPYEDDVSAVRAIFRWISGQDLRNYENQPDAPFNSAAYYLNELKNGRGRYDKIFNLMCEHARIPSASIAGHSKGIGYNVGDPLTPSTRNMWNAVLLGHDWYLIDVHWASRKVSGVEAEEWQLIENSQRPKDMSTPHDVYEFDEFYFLTNPEEFIYSHFPEQEVWQLLARPMTHAEFQKVILLKPSFFRFDMRIKSHPWCTLKSVDGAVNIELITEREDLSFSYELYRSTKVDSGQQLEKYLFLERNPDERKVCIEIRFPTKGKFKAEIYGKDSKSKLEWLCSYVLYCDKPETNCLQLPTNHRSEWGPGVDMMKAGVFPLTHKRGKIYMNGIETQIKFKLKLDVDLIAQLITINEEKLEKYVLLGVTDNIATVNVRIPYKGQFALCIFAKIDPYQQQFVNICNYLVKCTEDFGEVKPYPQTNNSQVGPMDVFHKLGLKLMDSLPGLSTVPRDGKFTFTVLIPDGTDYFPRMTLSTKDDYSDYIGWYRENDFVHFTLRFPNTGFYKFSLFAKNENDEGGYPEVLCLVLEVPWPMTDCLQFPKKFISYKDTYQTICPNQRLLAIGKTEKVKVFLPDARALAFIEDGSWTHLTASEDGMWEGQITPAGTADTISMAGKLPGSGDSFSSIMSFEVIPEKDLKHIFLVQKLSREEADQDYLERMSYRNSASKKSQGNSMMNQIQRIAKMRQQNLDDETLQQIQLQVDDDFGILPINGQVSDNLPNYLDAQVIFDNSEDESYDQLSEEENENSDNEGESEDDEQNEYLISDVDINLNDIRKENKMNGGDLSSQIELDMSAENVCLINERPYITVAHSSPNEFGEVCVKNIPLRVSRVQNDSIEESELEQLSSSKIKQISFGESFDEFIPDNPRCNSIVSDSDSELNSEISDHYDLTGHIKPEFLHFYNASPPPVLTPSNPELSQLVPKIDEVSSLDITPEEMHLYNAAPPPPPAAPPPAPAQLYSESSPSLLKISDVSSLDIAPQKMHLYNAAPPQPSVSLNSGSSPWLPKIDEVSSLEITPEEMHLYNAAPPPPPSDPSQLVPKINEVSGIDMKPEEMHLYNAAPPPPPSDPSQLVAKINEVSGIDMKPEEMHLYNAAPPPPPSPGGDFTEQLIKKVAEIEESVEKEELALKNFSYQELKGVDESILRQRPLSSQPVVNEVAASTFVEDKKPTFIVQPFVEAEQDEEVPLIKFVEYFIYFISLWSLLLYIQRLLQWRPY